MPTKDNLYQQKYQQKTWEVKGEIIFLNNYAQNYYTDVVTCG